MKRSSENGRKDRLAAALKENLKRRKAQARAKASGTGLPPARTLGTAPQASLDVSPPAGPKTAPKRI